MGANCGEVQDFVECHVFCGRSDAWVTALIVVDASAISEDHRVEVQSGEETNDQVSDRSFVVRPPVVDDRQQRNHTGTST